MSRNTEKMKILDFSKIFQNISDLSEKLTMPKQRSQHVLSVCSRYNFESVSVYEKSTFDSVQSNLQRARLPILSSIHIDKIYSNSINIIVMCIKIYGIIT